MDCQCTVVRPLIRNDNDDNYHQDDESTTNYDDDDDDDRGEESSYGSHSLAWTKRYRLIPYDVARKRAMSLGLRSQEGWGECIESAGNKEHGPYLPTRPEEMYPDDFEGWDDFWGCMRPYEETRQMVQCVLGLKSIKAYRTFESTDTKRAEGLRIPAKPDIVYKACGWIDDGGLLEKK